LTSRDAAKRPTTVTNRVLWYVTLAMAGFLLWAVLNDEGRPWSPESIRAKFSPFLIDESELKGFYTGLDVDSTAFSYITAERDAAAFWKRVSAAAETDGWRVVRIADAVGEFDQFQSEQLQDRLWCTGERVRVRREFDGRVAVGWIRVDSDQPITDITQTWGWGHAEYVWQRLEDAFD